MWRDKLMWSLIMDRQGKETLVSDLNAQLKGANTVVLGHYRGLTVGEMTNLRADMRAAEGHVVVVKNRLLKIACKGTPFENITDMMTGPTAIAFSEDVVAAAKITQAFADKNKAFEIIGGAMGDKRLECADVKALSSMPSLDALRSKLIGLIQAPATKVATLAQAPASKVARITAMKPENVAA